MHSLGTKVYLLKEQSAFVPLFSDSVEYSDRKRNMLKRNSEKLQFKI